MTSSKNYKLIIAVIALVAIGLALWYATSRNKQTDNSNSPAVGPTKIQGQIVCLPHRDTSGPQTLECAFGLKDDEGRYFALRDSDPTYKNISGVGTNVRVEVEGNFTPQEDSKYQSIGIIEVLSVTEIISDNFQIQNLPIGVLQEQIQSKYSANGVIYVFAMQNNLNYNYPALSGKIINWHGVLRSKNNSESWDRFFTIVDPVDPDKAEQKIKYNPVGGFSESGRLYIDIADDRSAGSGEGNLLRFSSGDDGKTWRQDGCYYFIPERYYPDYAQGKTDSLTPHELKESENCVY